MRIARVVVAAAVAVSGLVAGAAGPAGASRPTLSKSTDLGYHDRVTMHAEKHAGSVWNVRECWSRSTGSICTPDGGGIVPPSGVLDVPLWVTRVFDPGDGHPYDCTAAGTTCTLQVSTVPTGAVLPISFDPDAPRPTIAVAPSTGLGWHQPATVTGSGFPSNESIQLTECGVRNAPGQHDTFCRGVKDKQPIVTDGAGRFSVTGDTRRWIPHVIDCLDPIVRCVMRASLPSDFSRAGPVDSPLSFADDGQPVVIANDTSAAEHSGLATVVVRLSVPSTHVVTVAYATETSPPSSLWDVASATTDYAPKQSRLVFQPGETRHLIKISLIDDTQRENVEQFRIRLDTGAAHADSRLVQVYIDDED